jgi:hypothetical protein
MGNPASVLLLLRLLLGGHKPNEELASVVVERLQSKIGVKEKAKVVLAALLLEAGAACVALLVLVLFVAFFYLYCLPWLCLK